MKLLFDQNLSFRLCRLLEDLFPESNQARLLDLDEADDVSIWQFAKSNGFTIVTQDSDFADMASLYGPPPKVIWLRCGNQPTRVVENLLRKHAAVIAKFYSDGESSYLEIL